MLKKSLPKFVGQIGEHSEFPLGIAVRFDMHIRAKLATLRLAAR